MHIKTLRNWTAVVAGGIVLVGCQNLNLPDVNAVTLQQSLGSAGTIEQTVGSATKFYLGVLEGLDVRQGVSYTPSEYMEAVDEEITAGTDFEAMFTFSGFEPRQQFSNQNASPSWLNRIPSQAFGTAGSMCNGVLTTLKQGVIKIGAVSAALPQGSHTNRDQWWCEFIIGSMNMYRGVMFDQGIPSPDTTPINLNPFVEGASEVAHDSLIDFGYGQTEHAISMVLAAPVDTTSLVWINAVSYNNTDAAKIMYSTIARAIVMSARNTEERATLPVASFTWNNVITWIDSGITAGGQFCNGCANWSVDGQPQKFSQPGGLVNQGNSTIRGAENYYLNGAMQTGSSSSNARISIRFLGPYDTTGAWQWWLHGPGNPPGPACANAAATTVCDLNDTGSFAGRTDTTIGSPDPRINAIVGGVPQKGSAKNTNNGYYFGRFRCDGTATSAVGTANSSNGNWAMSNYIFFRYPSPVGGGYGAPPTVTGCVGTVSTSAPYEAALYSDMSPEEMNFLLAEAYIRTGNPALAVPIINFTRVGTAGLPPVTVNGVPATPGCIPRNEDNTCTNLMMTLLYEKRIESIGESELTNYADWRAFGKMLWGTMFQMPPEARELAELGLTIYTYGANSPGSAYVPCTGILGTGIGCTSIYP